MPSTFPPLLQDKMHTLAQSNSKKKIIIIYIVEKSLIIYSDEVKLSSLQTDNILKIELDMPSRTTRDFELTSSGYDMKAVLAASLQANEEEIVIDAR